MPIKVRQPSGLSALINPTTTAQNFAHPNIGGVASLEGDSPLSHTEMDNNWQSVYPVGSIYINATDSKNPNIIIGFGTWESFGEGRILIGHNGSVTSNRDYNDSPFVLSTIKSVTKANNSLSIKFKANHQFSVGQMITLSGVNDYTKNSGPTEDRTYSVNNREFEITALGAIGEDQENTRKHAIQVSVPGLATYSLGGTLSSSPTVRFAGSAFTSFDCPRSDRTQGLKFGYGGRSSHRLTKLEMPSHTHPFVYNQNYDGRTYNKSTKNQDTISGDARSSGSLEGGEHHNNIDKYITAYIWRRIA
jgi:hypothetical protein